MAFSSCIDEYNTDDIVDLELKHFIVGYISPDLPVRIKYDYVNNGASSQKKDSGATAIILLEDGITLDTLKFSFGQKFGNYVEYSPTYTSTDSTRFPRVDHEYSLKVVRGNLSNIYSFGKIPEFPMVDSVVLDVDVLRFNNNRTDYGAIFFNPNDRSKYMAFYGIHTGLFNEFSTTSFSEKIVEYHLASENYCGALKTYFPDIHFASAKLTCLKEDSKIVRFSDPNITIEDSINTSKMIVCSIREDLANFYGSREQYFEGTEFFFSPSQELPFTIKDDSHIGILGCIACKMISVKLR